MKDVVLELVSKIAHNFNDEGRISLYGEIDSILSDYELTPIVKDVSVKTVDILKYYLDTKTSEGRCKGTIKEYNRVLSKFCGCVSADFYSININQVRDYIDKCNKRYRRSTTRTIAERIKTFLKWADAEGYSNTIWQRIVPPPMQKDLRKYLEISEIEKIRKACRDTRERALVEFLLSTGCRTSEISDIALEDALSGKIQIYGKGNKERIVMVNEKAKFHIEEYIKDRDGKDWHLFTKKIQPYNRVGSDQLGKIMRNLSMRCGVNVYIHLLRHSFASNMLRAGASMSSIQKLLGHDTIKTTEIYAKTNDKIVEYEHYKYANC